MRVISFWKHFVKNDLEDINEGRGEKQEKNGKMNCQGLEMTIVFLLALFVVPHVYMLILKTEWGGRVG